MDISNNHGHDLLGNGEFDDDGALGPILLQIFVIFFIVIVKQRGAFLLVNRLSLKICFVFLFFKI